MATLADRLKNKTVTRGPGGVLTEQTPEEIQSLTARAGMQAPPVTPLGQALIGATPDQQKMAGTPAQKQAALSLASIPVESTLSGALRRGPVRSEATVSEQQLKKKSEDMKNLGGIGDRVADFIEAQRKKIEQSQPVQVQAQSQAETPAGTADLSPLKELLASYRNNPSDQQALLQINRALGYNEDRQLSPQEIDQLYESSVEAIARSGAEVVDDRLTVDDLIDTGSFGYSREDLAQLLGVPADQIGNYSVGQLKDAVINTATREFNTVRTLEEQAQSLQLGAAERGLAHQAAAEASRVGVRSTESDVANLEQQIANADQVQFAGNSYNVEDLLRDSTISDLISQYMNSAPDSDIRRQVEATEPELVSFINRNQALLQDASQKMAEAATGLAETTRIEKEARLAAEKAAREKEEALARQQELITRAEAGDEEALDTAWMEAVKPLPAEKKQTTTSRSTADILKEAADRRERERTLLRQKRQLITLLRPQFALLPVNTQDRLIQVATLAGDKALEVIRDFDWDNKKTGPENAAIIAARLATVLPRASVAAAQPVIAELKKIPSEVLKEVLSGGKGIVAAIQKSPAAATREAKEKVASVKKTAQTAKKKLLKAKDDASKALKKAGGDIARETKSIQKKLGF